MTILSLDTISKQYHHQNKEFKIIADVWLCGSAESDSEGNKFSGAYPAGFLKRFKSSFRDFIPTDPLKMLHVCAGRLPPSEGMRLDVDDEYEPDFLNDAENMEDIDDERFTWVIADPPYNEDASKKYYKRPLLKKSQMIREMTRVCKVNGFIALLDQYSPNSFPRCLKRIALVGVTSVPNTDMRIFTVWRKERKFETATTTSKKKKQEE